MTISDAVPHADEVINDAEHFVCVLYNGRSENVNEVRYALFCMGMRNRQSYCENNSLLQDDDDEDDDAFGEDERDSR